MYSKEEIKQLHLRFWENFGKYCEVHPLLLHKSRKWMLHRTKIKNIALRFEANRNDAKVILELNSRNENLRLKAFEILERYKVILEDGFDNGLIWEFFHEREDSRKEVCRIYTVLPNVDIHRQNQWPEIYRFFIQNMVRLEDNFMEVRDVLREELKTE